MAYELRLQCRVYCRDNRFKKKKEHDDSRTIRVFFTLNFNFSFRKFHCKQLHNIFFDFICFVSDVLIQRLSIQRVLEVSSDWTEDSHESPYSSIQYDFRITCEANYFGQGCAKFCRPRDDNFGHSTCSSNGSIVCLAGWKGDYCNKRKSLDLTKIQTH